MSSHPDMPDDVEDLAGEYVLGTLSAHARRQVESRLPHDDALRSAVQRWETRLQPLATLAQPVEPSPGLWPRIAASLGHHRATARSPSSTRGRRGLWASLAFWRGLSAAGLATAAILAAVLVGSPPSTEYVVVLVAPQSTEPGWVIQAAGTHEVQLIPLGPTTVPSGRSLEFWTKADDWQAPVSLGLVRPGETLRVRLADLPPLVSNQLFELTLEPATGSPTGLPTGPIQAIGRAVRVL